MVLSDNHVLNLNRGEEIGGRGRGLLALLLTAYKFGGNSHETCYLSNLKVSIAILPYSEWVAGFKREIYHSPSGVTNVCTSSRIYFPMSE